MKKEAGEKIQGKQTYWYHEPYYATPHLLSQFCVRYHRCIPYSVIIVFAEMFIAVTKSAIDYQLRFLFMLTMINTSDYVIMTKHN